MSVAVFKHPSVVDTRQSDCNFSELPFAWICGYIFWNLSSLLKFDHRCFEPVKSSGATGLFRLDIHWVLQVIHMLQSRIALWKWWLVLENMTITLTVGSHGIMPFGICRCLRECSVSSRQPTFEQAVYWNYADNQAQTTRHHPKRSPPMCVVSKLSAIGGVEFFQTST